MIRAPFKNRHTKQSGFTIIEVLIVLAIAGVIMLVVFLAVPALQRNSRNTQRRSDVSHLASLVDEYTANHGGALPSTIGATGLDITSENWSIMSAPATANIKAYSSTAANNYPTDTSTMYIITGATCNPNVGGTSGISSGSGRSFAVSYLVEVSGTASAANNGACIGG